MYSCSWAPSSAAAADQAKQKGEGKSKGEYLAYSARLKPRLSKHLCNCIKMDEEAVDGTELVLLVGYPKWKVMM